jgi:4,5:9,10-diseco-3-hydroxy-5,9,17-trioxoandrosta-1(10),2-diene-4-oate hydrolase
VTATLERASFTEHYVDVDQFHIRYMEAGSGPPLVWLHHAGGPRLSGAHHLLANTFRVIAFEVPGYGEGAPNERSRTLAELGETMLHAAKALGLERFNLWGTSFGGALAFWTACASPESIDALVLEGPGVLPPPNGYPPISTPEELHQYTYAHPERQPMAPPLEPALRDQRRALLERLQPLGGQEAERRMAELDVPTLVIFGTRDRLTPPELGRAYRERMPRCQFVLLYDAGHDASAERPEAFASLVSDFLTRREAFIVADRSSLLHP